MRLSRTALLVTLPSILIVSACGQKAEEAASESAATEAAADATSNSPSAAPDIGRAVAPGVAFAYNYAFTLPAKAITGIQQEHASTCAKLGTSRCRVTGMSYAQPNEDSVSARLDFLLAPDIAHSFASAGVALVEKADGKLENAQVTGENAGEQIELSQQDSAGIEAETQRIEARLAAKGLTSRERAELQSQLGNLREQLRGNAQTRQSLEKTIATTPVRFAYASEGLIGSGNAFGKAASASWSSLETMLGYLTLVVGIALPWLLLIGLIVVILRAPALRRLLGKTPPAEPQPPFSGSAAPRLSPPSLARGHLLHVNPALLVWRLVIQRPFKTMFLASALALGAFVLPAIAQSASRGTSQTSPLAELRQSAHEAYVYLYPLVTMDITRRVNADPVNTLNHWRAFPDASFRTVVRPNFDTLYSMAWIDLSGGPVAIRVPPSGGRYYLLQFLDMWTDSFAIPGTRTHGNEALALALVPPGWQGSLPEGLSRIDAPTRKVWLIGRTQTNGSADYPTVHRIQDGMRLEPLAAVSPPATAQPEPKIDPAIPPRIQVDAMSPFEFLEYGAHLLRTTRPHDTDWTQLERLKRLGIGPGLRFTPDKLGAADQAAIVAGVADARRTLTSREAGINPASNGWVYGTETMGVYGNAYLKRAIIARRGLGANPPEDAVYMTAYRDGSGNLLQSGQTYLLRFEKGRLPPAGAFWSVTLYDGDGFPIANAINRNALGDRDQLRFNPDGSLDLLIQLVDPGGTLSANWLPAPTTGAITLTLRIYLPGEDVLSRLWIPPAVIRL